MQEDEFVQYDEAVYQDPLDPVPVFCGKEALMCFNTFGAVKKNEFVRVQRQVRNFLDGAPRAEYLTKKGQLKLPRSATVSELLSNEHPDLRGLRWLKGNVIDHAIDHIGNVAICQLEANPAQQRVHGKNTLIYIAE